MSVYLTALSPTVSVTHGFLPAAARLGVDVVLLTDRPDGHRNVYAEHPCPPLAVLRCAVRDGGDVASQVLAAAGRYGRAEALLSNSDHLQAATSLAAEVLGLPTKSAAAAVSCKNKALTRRRLAAAGVDVVAAVEILPGNDPRQRCRRLPFPVVLKPREGVASEDVFVCEHLAELTGRVAEVRDRRPGEALLVEQFLPGELRTYETLGDGEQLHHLGSWRTTVSGPPFCAELRLDWAPDLPVAVHEHLRAQLAVLGVGLGAAHTEFVVHGERARIIEVNYRLPGDAVDIALAALLEVDLFADVLAVHLGRPVGAAWRRDPVSVDRHARLDYVFAERSGTLREAPDDEQLAWPGSVVVGHQRLREVAVWAERTGTNRDYLAAVYALGPEIGAVHDAVGRYRATRQWVIEQPGAACPATAPA